MVLSIINVMPRIKAEQSNRGVAIAVEISSIREVVGATGSLNEGLDRLVNAGVNTLVANEQTVGDAQAEGQLQFETFGDGTVRVSGLPDEMSRLRTALEHLGHDLSNFSDFGPFDVSIDPSIFRNLSIGIRRDEAALANDRGLDLVARFGNRPRQGPWLLREAAQGGADFYLPLGDSVLGFAGGLEESQTLLKELNIRYVSPEFVTMTGDGQMKAETPENAVRLHSAQTIELSRIDRASAIERYVKAYRERNVRILLIRPQNPAADAKTYGEFINEIVKGAVQDGGVPKSARPFDLFEVSSVMAGLLGLAMVPALAGVVLAFVRDRRWQMVAIGFLGVIGLLAFAGSLRTVTALVASIGFVVLAYLWLLQNPRLNSFLQYLGVSGLSLVGGLQVSGLLVKTPYMLQAGQFLGVKASVFMPILVVGLVLLGIWRPLGTIAREPILWGTAVLSTVGLAVLMFMNARTGNDNPAAVSGFELQFRDLLDRILPVRPRTKEFLIGHPALVIGLALWKRSEPGRPVFAFGLLFLAVSVIGQTSVVNTMCHLHTPVMLSLMRIVSGHVVGGIFGLVGWMVLRAALKPESDAKETA